MKIIESPREGMQSLDFTIPTEKKVSYIRQLLKVGFDTVEVGSIVSRKLIPQMADTLEVIRQVDFSATRSNRMVLVVNTRGAELISGVKEITHISYPFSISSTFLKKNLNATTAQSIQTVSEIVNLCEKTGKQPVIYISMAFGNPYGDPWNMGLLIGWIDQLKKLGVKTVPLSNVAIEIGPELIRKVFTNLVPEFPDMEFGLHLHTTNKEWQENVMAAYESGCRRFDSVISGYGGCPMTGKEMLGNLKTENLVEFARGKGLSENLDTAALNDAYQLVASTFVKPLESFKGI
ncbi:MAG: hydroxymethylglutaryl-CoA lyase [Bacteroidetes bacterium]|nr:hydroxymethylglutaryl-CoA lyase [Bacteroidota bacterium]